jgi:hypothetical protein
MTNDQTLSKKSITTTIEMWCAVSLRYVIIFIEKYGWSIMQSRNKNIMYCVVSLRYLITFLLKIGKNKASF